MRYREPAGPGPRGTRYLPKYKYAVYPGYVFSADGDRHFITFQQLCHLYGVPTRECFEVLGRNAIMGLDSSKLIKLVPQADGDYTLPSE